MVTEQSQNEAKLNEKKNKLFDLENESIKLEKKLKLAGEERDELLAEVKYQDKNFGGLKIRDRGLEMVLVDKEVCVFFLRGIVGEMGKRESGTERET